ncbi:serine/threonine-protein kinase [Lapillicoccus jejuensis]|uniref:non-specific serine/threonine protein kinase n=1 Tax=Lapillicoccus jejuensis TaxID=402171 RepID=A0A542DXG5_9MICO|nr:serine/threonine-protein kinase [Lapillicoccus jejuensis]TQJ07782.1 serine/threonine protein kinase [Lapillicoccus jejuensis]
MRRLGRYRLLERLGTGAFATVWLARDDDLEVSVALKVLADNWSGDAGVRERFLAEARLLRRIDDPRVVRVHDIGTVPDGDQPYFVMDLADGGTLADVVEQAATRPDAGRAVALAGEVARAVQVLHDHGVVHRDVKPSNLLIARGADGRPRVVVADLGMAKSLAEASGLTLTAGTPAWMAPEQVRGGGFDARADVYAVAAVTYALLTGRPPFEHASVRDVALRTDPPAAVALSVGLPAEVDGLLASALDPDPARRPASAAAFARLLDRAAAGESVQERRPARPATPAAPPGRWPARLVALWALAAFLVALALTYGALATR